MPSYGVKPRRFCIVSSALPFAGSASHAARSTNLKEVREEEKKDGKEKEVQETKNVGKVGIGVEGGKLNLNDVDLQGRMALHIAVLN